MYQRTRLAPCTCVLLEVGVGTVRVTVAKAYRPLRATLGTAVTDKLIQSTRARSRARPRSSRRAADTHRGPGLRAPDTTKAQGVLTWAFVSERVTRIELALSAWEADVLPLNYTRKRCHCTRRVRRPERPTRSQIRFRRASLRP
jgi:hypothetical protein